MTAAGRGRRAALARRVDNLWAGDGRHRIIFWIEGEPDPRLAEDPFGRGWRGANVLQVSRRELDL